ncbi:hypothetical protein FRACYDRAFT_270436 [Fragilariopsis cylindrus CCMP1102]|uniref:Uncharacterized protein n=1 Tax=Fragilariopsis cylindrus CCMP1102 TaxID=635003 RepID=A0A1E7F3W4_9STRA|nr:hypothetical protein FRACYDRAFT_270436 [Fragilariopsis cylindrus CCMP1102]|eukprot:OEU12695.1 hypothetical protein FRACYDRAFT_270436 [Fragilariopsis cylindrus CCMP1102]
MDDKDEKGGKLNDDKKSTTGLNSKIPLIEENYSASAKMISKGEPSSSNQSQAKSSLNIKKRTTGSIKKVVASRRTLQVNAKTVPKGKPSSSNQSQAKSSLNIKKRTTGSINKVVASRRTLQVKEGSSSSSSRKSTTIGRRTIQSTKERRALPKQQPKQLVSRDDAWYRKNGRTNSTSGDESFSFMRSTECFSNYTSQTENLLKLKAEEKKRCAKKIIV